MNAKIDSDDVNFLHFCTLSYISIYIYHKFVVHPLLTLRHALRDKKKIGIPNKEKKGPVGWSLSTRNLRVTAIRI